MNKVKGEESPQLIADSAKLINSSFNIEHSPAQEMVVNVTTSLEDSSEFEKEDGTPARGVAITVAVSMSNAEDSEDIRLGMVTTVFSTVVSQDGSKPDPTQSTKAGIIAAYSLAKSYILTTTAFSPSGEIIIPEVNPEAVIAEYGKPL
jgi:hypothetical protein